MSEWRNPYMDKGYKDVLEDMSNIYNWLQDKKKELEATHKCHSCGEMRKEVSKDFVCITCLLDTIDEMGTSLDDARNNIGEAMSYLESAKRECDY